MSLHHTVRHTLDTRAAEVAVDIDNTEASLRRLRNETLSTETVLKQLRNEEQAIIDARNLLEELA